jgi:hypothetical protein
MIPMHPMRPTQRTMAAAALLAGLVLMTPAWCGAEPQGTGPEARAVGPAAVEWRSMFDGKTLGAWKQSGYGGAGDTEAVDGVLRIPMGVDLSGVTWGGEFPKEDYEIELEARRVEGDDFFCGLTFPVGADPCSFIVGGWGGAVVGLSSIDGEDAANNKTTLVRAFKTGQWYAVKVRVTPERIECFLDGERVVNQPRKGHTISIRESVEPSRPLGIASYCTVAELRKLRWRPVAGPQPR